MFVREGVNFGGKELTIETGRMAKQAAGSCLVQFGDTMVLAAVTEAFRQAAALQQERMGAITGGLGGLGLPGF